MEWIDSIPLSPDETYLYNAYNLACRIEDYYEVYHIAIRIIKGGYDPRCGDGFKLKAKLIGETYFESVKKCVNSVRIKLGIPVLQVVEENGILYFTTFTSSHLSLNNDLKLILKCHEYKSSFEKMQIAHPVGVDFNGNPVIFDLAKYPHTMVSGTTRSGKTTALKCLLVSLSKYSPSDINLLLLTEVLDYQCSRVSRIYHIPSFMIQMSLHV